MYGVIKILGFLLEGLFSFKVLFLLSMVLYEILILMLYFFLNFGIIDFMYDLYEGFVEIFNVLFIFELLDEDLLLL